MGAVRDSVRARPDRGVVMSTDTCLHNGETLHADDLSGETWTVQSKHHGHTMRVEGRVFSEGVGSGMCIVQCSCGERFRMADVTIRRHV